MHLCTDYSEETVFQMCLAECSDSLNRKILEVRTVTRLVKAIRIKDSGLLLQNSFSLIVPKHTLMDFVVLLFGLFFLYKFGFTQPITHKLPNLFILLDDTEYLKLPRFNLSEFNISDHNRYIRIAEKKKISENVWYEHNAK